jgi:hypothetical protein
MPFMDSHHCAEIDQYVLDVLVVVADNLRESDRRASTN